MAAFDRIIRYTVYGTMAYITAVMAKNWYYNKRLARFGKDIYHTDPDSLQGSEKEEYLKLKEYYDAHMGRQILDNIHSTKYLADKVKERLTMLEIQRIQILDSMVGVKDEKVVEKFNVQLRVLDKEIEELSDFRNKVRKERFYDMYPDEDPEKIN